MDIFVMTLSELDVQADPDHIKAMGEELHERYADTDPAERARAEWEAWPRHDH